MGSDRFPDASQTSRRVGAWQLERELGRGSYGVVYLATPEAGGEPVALKVLLRAEGDDPESVARFEQEARVAARLRHPGLVRVLDHGRQGDLPWMAMEYCPGPTLHRRIRDQGPLPPREAAGLVAEVARAVAHAHDQGVIHRDLKPANVIVDERSGRPRVTDFGLARDRALGRSLTATGEALGTPYYMAPEQVRAQKDVDARADVWALGVILYECLTGKRPFDGRTSFLVAQAVLQTEPLPPSRLRAGIPAPLEAVCLRCLRREREERYASAGALAFALEAMADAPSLATEPSLSAIRPRPPRRGPSRLAVAAAAAVVALGGAAAGALLAARRGATQPGPAGADEPAPSPAAQAVAARLGEAEASAVSLAPLAETVRLAEEAEALAGIDPDLRARARVWRAGLYLRCGRTVEARTLAEGIERNDALGLQARWVRAAALEDEGDDAGAERELASLAAADPDGALGLTAEARLQLLQRRGTGEDVLPRALEADPGCFEARLTMARSLMCRSQLPEAGELLAELERERPDDVHVWLTAAAQAERRDDRPGEERALARAFAAGQGQAPRGALLRRVNARLRDADLAAARSDVSALLRRAPDDLSGLMLQAVLDLVESDGQRVDKPVIQKLGQACKSDRARYTRRALEQGEFAHAALMVGGWRLDPRLAPRDLADLRDRLEQRAAGADPVVRADLAAALMAAAGGSPLPQVEPPLSRARAAAPEDPVVALEAARILCGRDAPGAGEALTAALRLCPGARPELERLKAERLVRLGKNKEAVAALREVERLDPRGPDGLLAAAQAASLELWLNRRPDRGPRGGPEGRGEEEGGERGRGGRERERDPGRLGRWEAMLKARRAVERVVEGFPRHERARVVLATLWERYPLHALAVAEDAHRRGGLIDAQLVTARASAAWELHLAEQRPDEARAEFEEALLLGPGAWHAWRAGQRAMGGRRSGGEDLEFAARMAEAAISRDPAFAPAWQLRGAVAMRQGADREVVLGSWREALRLDPSPINHRWLEDFLERYEVEPALLDELGR